MELVRDVLAQLAADLAVPAGASNDAKLRRLREVLEGGQQLVQELRRAVDLDRHALRDQRQVERVAGPRVDVLLLEAGPHRLERAADGAPKLGGTTQASHLGRHRVAAPLAERRRERLLAGLRRVGRRALELDPQLPLVELGQL